MKYKHIVLIILLLLALAIGGGAVSASQNNLTNDSNEIINQYNDTGTFRDLNNLIENSSDNSEIVLKKDYTYNNDTDANFSKGININQSLTIDGQGHVINADAKAKIFKIHAEVILKNITFVNAFGEVENHYYSVGVAVRCFNPTKIINCSFKNNHVQGFGPAITFEKYGEIINCSFINNSATREGGAVYFANNGYVYNSIFINNTGLTGGAIYSDKCKIIKSVFLNNFAQFGGAIYTNDVDITNSTFKDNYAILGGGSVYTNFASITHSNFINSSAQDAGAINLQWGDSNIIDCNFTNCYAKNTGGAIVFSDFIYSMPLGNEYFAKGYNCNIINCSFLNNHAKSSGAVNFKGSGEIIACKFINNTSKSNGGAVNFKYIDKQQPIIELIPTIKIAKHSIINCSFINNDASLGGGIHCEYGNIINCSFLNNTANIGDAIYFKDNKSKLINSTINGLVYEFDGEHNETSQITPRLTIISNNVYSTHSAEDIVEIEFKSNIENIKLWVEIPELMQKTNLTINNFKTSISLTNLTKSEIYTILCGFNEEKNDDSLSPVILGYDNILGIVDKKTVEIKYNKNIGSESNNSFNDLQILINDYNSGELNLENDYIYNNDTDSDFTDGINIYKSIIINGNNHKINAKKLARIFTITSNKVILKNINFVNGYSTRGSAIYANSSNNITLINCSFINNNALDSGGALSLNNVVFSIINCSFINNYARWYSGAISSTSQSNSYIINSVFINNIADYSNGAIGSSNCNVINSTFINNRADYYAGAINLGEGNIVNSIFINNFARICGGAVYANYLADVLIVNSTFINNSANADGGAICLGVNSKAQIINCNFINNYAINGGAISNNYHILIIGCHFKDNHAEKGGAIYSNGYYALVVNSIFGKDKHIELSGDITLINCHLNNEKLESKVKIPLSKKSKVKIYLSDVKTFKSKNKYKKYTVTLKSGKKPVKKVAVVLKIKSKRFKAITNNKGKATFKLKKLTKKGKYKATIIFKGTQHYKKASKKVKIIIK